MNASPSDKGISRIALANIAYNPAIRASHANPLNEDTARAILIRLAQSSDNYKSIRALTSDGIRVPLRVLWASNADSVVYE